MARTGIKVGSVTYASKGKAVLEKNGIKAYISRNTHPISGESCGFLITVEDDATRAIAILNRNGVKTYGITDGGIF